MGKRRFWGIISIWIGLLFGLSAMTTSDAATNVQKNNIGYSVAAQLPTNQLNSSHSFFDLKMQTNQTQTLKVVIYNVTNRDIKVKMGIHTAYTNSNGLIEYVTPAKHFDRSLKYQLGELTKIKGPTVVVVPANGSKTVEAQVKIPTIQFNGAMLGGWYFEKIDEKVTSDVKGSMNVHNQYSYVVGMKYSFGKAVKPKLSLDKVEPGLENYHQGIFPYLRNVAAVIVPDLSLETTITNKADKSVVKTVKKTDVQMAPNSVFRYPIMTGTSGLKAGNYHLRMIAKNKTNRWVFDKDFTITAKAAKKYARQAVEHRAINPLWLVVAGAMGTLILGGLIFWLVYFTKRRKRTD